jgi:hypothetical protein
MRTSSQPIFQFKGAHALAGDRSVPVVERYRAGPLPVLCPLAVEQVPLLLGVAEVLSQSSL